MCSCLLVFGFSLRWFWCVCVYGLLFCVVAVCSVVFGLACVVLICCLVLVCYVLCWLLVCVLWCCCVVLFCVELVCYVMFCVGVEFSFVVFVCIGVPSVCL